MNFAQLSEQPAQSKVSNLLTWVSNLLSQSEQPAHLGVSRLFNGAWGTSARCQVPAQNRFLFACDTVPVDKCRMATLP